MVTFSVTIDKESHRDLFLQIMDELKFVVSVSPEKTDGELNPSDFALPGREATEGEIEQLMVLSEESETYTMENSKKLNKQQFDQWLEKNK